MALIQCHECKGQVSDTAATCPHCGAQVNAAAQTPEVVQPKPGAGFATLLVIAAFIAIIWGLSNRSDPEPEKSAAAPVAPEAAHTFKPEMVVTFKDGTWACLNRDDLQQLFVHGMKGEATKAKAMDASKGGSCTYIAPKQRVRLLSVEYNDPAIDLAVLELVGEKNKDSAVGAWALSIGAEVSK